MENSRYNEMRRTLATEALEEKRGNRFHAAIAIGVSPKTLRRWMHEFKLLERFPEKLGRPSHFDQGLKRIPRARRCLRCGDLEKVKREHPGICGKCKRHVDFKEVDQAEYAVHL